jgi:uncharacterized protein (TIGR03382 family)
VAVRVLGGDGMSAVILQDGAPSDRVDITGADWSRAFAYPVGQAGARFRVHIAEGPFDVVITNHVYATYAEPDANDAGNGCGCHSNDPGGPSGLALVLGAWLLRRRRSRTAQMH